MDQDADDKLPPEPYREILVRISDDSDYIEILYLDPQAGERTLRVSPEVEQDQPSPTTEPEK
jgi:hypothetical protein